MLDMKEFPTCILHLIGDINIVIVEEPKEKLLTTDKIIGELDDAELRLWQVLRTMRRFLRQTIIPAVAKEGLALVPKGECFWIYTEAIKDLFYGHIRCRFPYQTFMKSLGVREGRKIVAMENGTNEEDNTSSFRAPDTTLN